LEEIVRVVMDFIYCGVWMDFKHRLGLTARVKQLNILVGGFLGGGGWGLAGGSGKWDKKNDTNN
jgi:hypothetical protein